MAWLVGEKKHGVVWKSDFGVSSLSFLPILRLTFFLSSHNLCAICLSDVDEGYLRLSPSYLVSFSCLLGKASKQEIAGYIILMSHDIAKFITPNQQ